jgi:hypothetical protein
VATGARPDIARQQTHDLNYDGRQATLAARMKAVLGAQQALAHGEPNAAYALRQSLVDLAAVAVLLADEMPAPRPS